MSGYAAVRNWLTRPMDGEVDSPLCEHILCRNGLRISAQASAMHSCSLKSYTAISECKVDRGAGEPNSFEVMLRDVQNNHTLTGPFIGYDNDPVGFVSPQDIEELIAANGGWVLDPAPQLPRSKNVLDQGQRKLDL